MFWWEQVKMRGSGNERHLIMAAFKICRNWNLTIMLTQVLYENQHLQVGNMEVFSHTRYLIFPVSLKKPSWIPFLRVSDIDEILVTIHPGYWCQMCLNHYPTTQRESICNSADPCATYEQNWPNWPVKEAAGVSRITFDAICAKRQAAYGD